jgi:hypothetical protein
MTRTTFRLAFVAAAIAALLLPGSAFAGRKLPKEAKDLGGVVVASDDGGNKQAVSDAIEAYVGDIVTEAAAKAAADNATARLPQGRKVRTSPRRLKGSADFSAYASRGWSCSSMDARFSDHVSWPWWGETSADISGSSATHWWGGCPYNAGAVTLDDTICFDTVSFGASFSGVGFSNTGGGCGTWSRTIGSNWTITHYYSGVHGSAGIGAIYRVRQATGGTYRFGTTFVGLNANGSKFI